MQSFWDSIYSTTAQCHHFGTTVQSDTKKFQGKKGNQLTHSFTHSLPHVPLFLLCIKIEEARAKTKMVQVERDVRDFCIACIAVCSLVATLVVSCTYFQILMG